jgi:hypothetical protein
VGGSAASGKTKPGFSREQRGQYDAFVKALPAPLVALVPNGLPKPLVDAVLAAVDPNSAAGRTVQQLVEYRLMPKWDRYYSSQDQAGPLEKPVGVLVAMLRRDAECGNDRCDERTNVDTGEPCSACGMRAVDRRADRLREENGAEAASGWPDPVVIPSRAPKVGRQAVHAAPSNPPKASGPPAVAGDAVRGAAMARSLMVDKAVRPRR